MPSVELRSHRLSRLWRSWLRSESPRRPVLRWSRLQKSALLILCVLVALVSSWPWLVEPDLRPGLTAPFDAVAPKEARVVDSEALEQRRSSLGSSTFVQVLNPADNQQIRMRLERYLSELERVANSEEAERIGPVNLSADEQQWLEQRTPEQGRQWDMALRRALDRMLSQGLVNNLALEQLQQSTSLQLEGLEATKTPAARSLGSKLLTTTLQGASNLQTDPLRSQRLIEELITQQGIPTIEVSKGDVITRKGEPISSQAYDVLDYFGMVNRRPKLGLWISHFTEALAGCGVLLLVMRRERPCLEAPHGLLALGLLLLSQTCKLWFGASVSPLAVIVPPTLLLAQGLGTTSALAWLAMASLLWPTPVTGLGEGRLLIAAATATVAAIQAGRLRSEPSCSNWRCSCRLERGWPNYCCPLKGLSLTGSWMPLLPNAGNRAPEALLLGLMMMLAILVIPLLESSFGLLTRARLMELADQERPLLRRLSSEAPGTFEHTLMICGLAEEGARAIDADVDLIRTGSLYHDVGKLHAPDWFIENQTSGENPHTRLNDPLASAGVLQAHVDEGLKLARRHRLPRPIADFIPEHQERCGWATSCTRPERRTPTLRKHGSATTDRRPVPKRRAS